MIGLRHLALRVRDVQRSLDFYTKVLALWVDWQPDDRNVYLTSGSDNLALHQCDETADCILPAGVGLDHFGFLVSRPEEVDEWAVRLVAQGIPLTQGPTIHRDGSRSLYFQDPDGYLIQLLFHPRMMAG